MAWILLRLSNYQQVAPLVRTGGSRHTGLAAPPHRNIQMALCNGLSGSEATEYSCMKDGCQIKSISRLKQAEKPPVIDCKFQSIGASIPELAVHLF